VAYLWGVNFWPTVYIGCCTIPDHRWEILKLCRQIRVNSKNAFRPAVSVRSSEQYLDNTEFIKFSVPDILGPHYFEHVISDMYCDFCIKFAQPFKQMSCHRELFC